MKTDLRWNSTGNGTDFFWKDEKVGTAVGGVNSRDSFALVEPGVVCWTRTAEKPTGRMEMRFEADYEPRYQLIPALQYDGNRCSVQDYVDVRNSDPHKKTVSEKRGLSYFAGNFEEQSGEPWRFAWHRMSVPGATYSEGETQSFAMFLPRGQMDGACSMYPEGGKTVHKLLWPEQDGPLPCPVGGKLIENYENPIEPRRRFQAMLVFAPVTRPRTAWHKLLDAAWKQNYTLRAPERSYEELWKLGTEYAKLLYTEEDDGFKGFSIGFTWKNGEWVKRPDQKYEIGWCGQNASLANSLLAHAKMTGDRRAQEIALGVLDAWIAATRPNGLIPTHYDDNQYTNGFGKTVDACNLGTAAVQLFEAEDRAAALGVNRLQYGLAARSICDFALRVMNENGRIGKSWLEKDLSPAVKEGTTGAFLTMGLCEGARRTGRADYLAAAEKSCVYYSRELATNGYTTAGALDIFSIDKESSIPLLKSGLMLYRLTGEKQYLVYAENAAWYLSTWQWHYSRPIPAESLLSAVGFDTFGGTAVSIHGGMDPFALCYVNDLCDLAEYTGNPQWKERAGAVWRNGQTGISDGGLVVDGKAPRPAGSQDESCQYTFSAYSGLAPSQWLVAWPTAFRLETLRRILPGDGSNQDRVL